MLVGLPAGRAEPDLRTGAGRVWTQTLSHVAREVEVVTMRLDVRRGLRRRRRPDVWLANGHEGAIDAPELVVVINHGAPWLVEDAFWDLTPRAFAELLIPLSEAAIRSADHVIVPSQYTRRSIIGGLGRDPATVTAVPHGVNADVFRPSRGQGRKLVEHHAGTIAPYVLFASIPSIPQKNLAALKQAMEILVCGGHPHVLVIAGGTAGGESEAALEEIVRDLPSSQGRVLWLGLLDDSQLAAVMADAAAFCLPSFFESFGLTALEALACGAPVIVSDRGALPEVVGDAALIAPPDPGALADALQTVVSDDACAQRLRTAGPLRARELGWDRTAAGWLSVLRLAAGRDD